MFLFRHCVVRSWDCFPIYLITLYSKESTNDSKKLFQCCFVARTWDALTRMTSLTVLFVPSAILFPLGYLSDNVNEIGWTYTGTCNLGFFIFFLATTDRTSYIMWAHSFKPDEVSKQFQKLTP